jgi:hypothetical protein
VVAVSLLLVETSMPPFLAAAEIPAYLHAPTDVDARLDASCGELANVRIFEALLTSGDVVYLALGLAETPIRRSCDILDILARPFRADCCGYEA